MSTADNCSIKRAFTLLEVACRPSGRLTLGQIAAEAGMPVPTAHRLLRTLKLVGAVESVQGGGYRLGQTLSRIDLEWSTVRNGIGQRLQTQVATLVNKTGLSAHIGIFDDERMTRIVASADIADDPSCAHLRRGQYEAYCLAVGQILLASQPREQQFDYLYAGPLEPLTEETIIEPSRLLWKLSQIGRLGFALETGEFEPDIWSLAVPIRDDGGKVIAALGVCGRTDASGVSALVNLPHLQDVAAEVAADLADFPNGVKSIFFID